MPDRRFSSLRGEIRLPLQGIRSRAHPPTLILAAFLEDRRGYPVFILAAVLYAVAVAVLGHVLLALIALGVVLVCGYAILSLYDYRLTLWAGGSA